MIKKVLTFFLVIDDIEQYTSSEKRAKLHAVYDKIKNELNDSQITSDPKEADIILVGGGDGMFLKTQRQYLNYGKPFYGINAGRKGNLMNNINHPLPQSANEYEVFSYPIYKYCISNHLGEKYSGFYCNEITIGGDKDSYYEFSLQGEKIGTIKDLLNGSALIINTAQGMTGYAGPLHEPLLPLKSTSQRIIGGNIAGFDYLHIGAQKITIEDTLRRKNLMASLDGRRGPSINAVQKIEIFPSDQTFDVAYHKNESYQEKRRIFRKEKNTPIISYKSA